MSSGLVASIFSGFHTNLVSIAAISLRLLPTTLLCPLLGGPVVPTHVKLGSVLSMSIYLHNACGVRLQSNAFDHLVASIMLELSLGIVIAMIASAPFHAARIGGRFIDVFRGTSAEAILPLTGSREAVSADLIASALVAVASIGVGSSLVISGLVRSFAWTPLGGFTASESSISAAVESVAEAFATGAALAAPVAATSFLIDAIVAMIAKAAPGSGFQDGATPSRILVGGFVLFASFSASIDQLMSWSARTPELLQAVLEPLQ